MQLFCALTSIRSVKFDNSGTKYPGRLRGDLIEAVGRTVAFKITKGSLMDIDDVDNSKLSSDKYGLLLRIILF